MKELQTTWTERYKYYILGVPYLWASQQRCDLCLGVCPDWDRSIEIKMIRFLGDNGKPNDNMLMHILSPYFHHRSAITDCGKLVESGLKNSKVILIYGFAHDNWPLGPPVGAFETLAAMEVAAQDADLGVRLEANFEDVEHPIHSSGKVLALEIVPEGSRQVTSR